MKTNFMFWILVVFLIGLALGELQIWTYKRILVMKSRAYETGTSNVEYINGTPYVIMTEEDYYKYEIPWYSTELIEKLKEAKEWESMKRLEKK